MPTQQHTLLQLLEQGCAIDFTLYVITTKKDLKSLSSAIKKAKSVCINVQGTDIDPTLSAFAGMAIAINNTEVYFIPRQNNEDPNSLSVADIASDLQAAFSHKNIEKVIYNKQFNQTILEHNNMPLAGPIFDISTAASLVIHLPKPEVMALLKAFYHKSADIAYQQMLAREQTSSEPMFIEKNLWHTIADAHQTIILRDILKVELQCLVDNVRDCKHS